MESFSLDANRMNKIKRRQEHISIRLLWNDWQCNHFLLWSNEFFSLSLLPIQYSNVLNKLFSFHIVITYHDWSKFERNSNEIQKFWSKIELFRIRIYFHFHHLSIIDSKLLSSVEQQYLSIRYYINLLLSSFKTCVHT